MNRYTSRFIPKSRIGRSVVVLMSGTAMAQIIIAVSMPIVTRLYSPEMIGIISVYLAFFGFWNTLLTWRYESALLITKDEEESHHVFRLGAILVFFNALVSIPVLGWLNYEGVLGFDVLPIWAPFIVFLSSLGFGWFMLYRAWLLRLGAVRVVGISAIARAGANSGTRVLAGIMTFGVYGLFLAEILGSWSALGAVRKRAKLLLKVPVPEWNVKKIKAAATKYKKFAQYELPSALVDQLAMALPVPVVGTLYGAEAAGWFGLARLLYAIPNGQIGKAAGDVFQMELSRCVREGKYKRGNKLFYQFSIRLSLVGLVPLGLAVFAAHEFVPLIFGDDWSQMGAIVSEMAPWMFAALIVSSMSRTLSVLQKQQWKLLYDTFSLLVVLSTYYWASTNEVALLDFIRWLSAGMVMTYLFYFWVIALALKSKAQQY